MLGVVYTKQLLGGPAQVLEYLGRYTRRVAISNERILGMNGSSVRFQVHDSANCNRKKVMRLEEQSGIGSSMQHEWCFDRTVCAAFWCRCKPQMLSRISVSSSPIAAPHDIGLTPHFKTLQSP